VPLEAGFLIIGGNDVEKCFAECYQVNWDAAGNTVTLKDFPKLPRPLSNCAAALIGDTVYVLGGREKPHGPGTRTFLSLNLKAAGTPEFAWKENPAWDGPARFDGLAVAGFDGDSDDLYLLGGRNPNPLNAGFLADLHRYDPLKKSWAILGNALDHKGQVSTFLASPALYVPPHHMLLIGSSDQNLISYVEGVGRRMESTEDAQEKADCRKLVDEAMKNFPGYSRNALVFDMRSSDWIKIGTFPERPPVAAPVVPWQGGMVIPCGELGPGKRSGQIWECRVKKKARLIE
jgi:N-acetylneuraminic acid mutarotase